LKAYIEHYQSGVNDIKNKYRPYPKIQEKVAFLVCAALPHTLKMRFFHNFRIDIKE